MAQKKTKQESKTQLPHYYRVIPAPLHSMPILTAAVCFVLFICAFICLLYIFFSYKEVQQARIQELHMLKVWENAISKHPTYPQTYYNAALHAARLGDNQKALEYINKALILNENYEPARELKKIVGE